MFCTYCGHKLDLNNKCTNEFCPSIIDNVTPSINGLSKIELSDFLGKKNSIYYLDNFLIHSEKSKFISWNTSAFLFHWIWMFYRKMNLIASIYLFTYFIGLIFLSPINFIILSLIGHVLCGLFGNAIYKNYCFKRISHIKPMAERINPSSYTKMLQYYGSTSTVLAIIMSFIYSFSLLILLTFCVDTNITYSDPSYNIENPFNYYEDEDEYDLPYWYDTPENYLTPDEDYGSYI